MTFVGIGPCGHASYVAQDPATYQKPYARPERPDKTKRGYDEAEDIDWLEQEAEEYRSLVDSLRYYAQHGQVRLVGDADLTSIIDGMKNCRCPEGTK